MTTTQIPAEHLAKLQAASTDQVGQILDHNLKAARKEYAAGNHTQAKRWYAYVDACQAILDERSGLAAYAAEREQELKEARKAATATERQVDYIAKLIHNGHADEGGFSGLVSSLHTNGRADRDAIAKLTKAQASQVIDSLTGTY